LLSEIHLTELYAVLVSYCLMVANAQLGTKLNENCLKQLKKVPSTVLFGTHFLLLIVLKVKVCLVRYTGVKVRGPSIPHEEYWWGAHLPYLGFEPVGL